MYMGDGSEEERENVDCVGDLSGVEFMLEAEESRRPWWALRENVLRVGDGNEGFCIGAWILGDDDEEGCRLR